MSKPLKVLVVAPEYPYPVVGGLQKQAHELNKELLQAGCDILVLSSRHHRDSAAAEVVDGVPVMRGPWLGRRRVRLFSNALWTVLRLLMMAGRYDVVHIHNLSTIGAVSAVAARMRGAAVVLKLPNVGDLGIPGLRRYVFGDHVINLLRSVSAFVAMSERSVEELLEINVPGKKILRMVNGLNVAEFDSLAAATAARGETDELTVIFTGRLVESKGVQDLLAAWSILQQRGDLSSARLQIVGSGPEEGRLQRIAEETGVGGTVDFMGFSDSVAVLLGSADIFVLPSYSEGNSNAVLEAMAAGIPVVSTDVGGTRLLLGDVCGRFLTEPGNVDGLASHLSELLRSKRLRIQIGRLLRERVVTHFDIRVVGRAYTAVYSALATSAEANMEDFRSSVFNL